jgi:DNA-binding beta-propeller fold protein YncE
MPTIVRVRRTIGGALGIAILALAAAGCSGQPAAPASAGHGRPLPASSLPPPVHPVAHPAGVVTRTQPRCSTATQVAPRLPPVTISMSGTPLNPFDVVVAPGNRWAFVSLTGANAIEVLRVESSGGVSPVRRISLPVGPLGETLTPNGRYLLAADGAGGAEVVSVAAAESGARHPVLGDLTSYEGLGAISVTVSPDGRFAFVVLEDSAEIAVFNLGRAIAAHLAPGVGYLGAVSVGPTPTEVAFSPNGRWLYATSEGTALNVPGTLELISAARAESEPSDVVVRSVRAGCNPVRVLVAPDGVLWVTARASDAVLAFSAVRLQAGTKGPLLAVVRVGSAPVDLALAGSRLVVTDSDRFDVPGGAASLAVVDAAAALAGRPALLGYLPAGGFPRQITAEPQGPDLLVTNYSSSQLETVRVADLP